MPVPLDRSSQPGRSRPCLLLGHAVDRHTGRLHAIVAYGTSQMTDANRGHEIRIDDPEHMQAASLDRPTRFVLTRVRALPANAVFFAVHRKLGTADIGTLPPVAAARLRALIGDLAMRFPHQLGFLTAACGGTSVPGVDARELDGFLAASLTGRPLPNVRKAAPSVVRSRRRSAPFGPAVTARSRPSPAPTRLPHRSGRAPAAHGMQARSREGRPSLACGCPGA